MLPILRRIETMTKIFSDPNGMKLGINKRKKTGIFVNYGN